MTKEKLLKKHPVYEANIDNWKFWGLAYDGGKPFIQKVLYRNERESSTNYQQRLKEAFNFNYCKSVVDLFNFYLTEKPCIRNIGDLTEDRQWQMFFQDCDFQGTNLPVFINEAQKFSSVYGSLGVLVNKPRSGGNLKEEIKNKIYPYCSVFTMPHIWDWKIGVNPVNGRPILTYLKLECDDGTILIWYENEWQRWALPGNQVSADPEMIESGPVAIGEIPFVWMPNTKNMTNPILGSSDIEEISLISASMVRNFSCGEEIVRWAAFPMLRLPMRAEGDEPLEERVGVTAVHEFNPEHGDGGKPDWMPTEVAEPIDAILRYSDRKIDELHRIAHLSGVHGHRRSKNVVSSGISLRYEFQQINASLMIKATFMAEAELKIIKLWLKWQKKEELIDEIHVERSKAFSVDDLSASLDNLTKAMEQVHSATFNAAAQRYLVRRVLPDMSEKEFAVVQDEIEKNKEAEAQIEPVVDRTPNTEAPEVKEL